jgi:hypothetical protein
VIVMILRINMSARSWVSSFEKIYILMINFKMTCRLFVIVYSVYLLMSNAGVLLFSTLTDDSMFSTKVFSN